MNLSPDTSVLITGASGALGWTLAGKLSLRCRVAGTYHSHDSIPSGVERVHLDLADTGSIDDLIETHRPEVIVHAAAMTDPDACERDPVAASAVNLGGSLHLAARAADNGVRIIFISTDLVFDGRSGNYAETDRAAPLSHYGRTKLDAERAVLEVPGNVVMRSSLIFGWGSPTSGTFLSGLYARLSSGESMRLFTDQMRNPVLESDLAEAVVLAVEHDIAGTYHVGGPEAVSRYEFGRAACDVFGLAGGLIEPIGMNEYEYAAARPLDSTLDISRFTSATGFKPHGVRDGLRLLKASLPD